MRVVIIGAGGQAREVRWILSELAKVGREYSFVGFVVSDLVKLGNYDSKSEVLGDFEWLSANRSSFDALVIGIGMPAARLKVAREVERLFPDVLWPVIIHPSVTFDSDSCRIGRGSIMSPGVRLTVNVEISEFTLLNQNVTIGHETKVGSGVVINPGANISGGVVVSDGVLIGTGAQILQYLKIRENSIVGAGAVVTRDVELNTTVVGVPAKLKN